MLSKLTVVCSNSSEMPSSEMLLNLTWNSLIPWRLRVLIITPTHDDEIRSGRVPLIGGD